jgi:hypothetical protein
MADTPDEWRAERGDERADGPDGPVAGWLDDRGVSEVIGSILVFGLLVSLLAIVQTQAVPDANGEVEFQHNKEVQRDITKLSESFSRTAATGSSETVSVATGTTYPSRLVLYNPPAPTGSLRTSERAGVGIVNVSGTDPETRDYVFGSLGGFPNTSMNTSRLAYSPDYNRYDSAPVTALEYGTVYDQRGNETRVQTAGAIVDGKRIELRLLGDGLDAAGQLTTSVQTKPVSTGGGIEVRSLGDFTGSDRNLTLQLPTRMSEAAWREEVLAGAIDDPGGSAGAAPEASDTCAIQYSNGTTVASSFGSPDMDNGRYIQDCQYFQSSSGPNYMVLKFEPNTQYQLRMTKIGFESGTDEDPRPKYVTLEERSVAVNDDGSVDVSAVVRDRYHNPVSGIELYANISAGRTGAFVINDTGMTDKNVSVTTDADGVATVTFASTSAFRGSDVTFIGDFDGDGTLGSVNPLSLTADKSYPENATVSVSRTGVQPITLSDATIASVGSAGGPGTQVNLTVRNGGSDRRVTEVKLNYATIHEQKRVINETNTITNLFNLIGDTLVTDLEFTTTNATSVVDGPDSIESVVVDHPGSAAGGDPLTGPATENGGPVSVDTPSSLPAIPGGGTADIVLTFDESVNQGIETKDFGTGDAPDDMLAVSVTIEYSDGYRETYTTNLHATEDMD